MQPQLELLPDWESHLYQPSLRYSRTSSRKLCSKIEGSVL